VGEGNGEPKTVPESQLLALKATTQKQIDKLKAQVAELEKGKDTEYQARLGVESSLKKVQKELTEAQASVGELDKVKAERDTATKSRDELSQTVIDLTRQNIEATYVLEEGVLEGKSLDELNTYKQVLEDTKAQKRDLAKAGVDAGGGGEAVVTGGRTGRQLIKEGLAAQE